MGHLVGPLTLGLILLLATICRAQYCEPCLPGFSSEGCPDDGCSPGFCNTTCAICPAGTFSANTSDSCTQCEAGTVSQPGSGNCTGCFAGTYASVADGVCLGCPDGSWSGTGASNCQPCGQGHYSGVPNATTSTVCTPCPAGYYCPEELNPAPVLCPHNTYCPVVSFRPRHCGFWYASESGSVKCSISNVVWLFVGIGGVIVLLGIGLVLLRIGKQRRVESAREFRQHEATKLIPKPLPGPIYSGD